MSVVSKIHGLQQYSQNLIHLLFAPSKVLNILKYNH